MQGAIGILGGTFDPIHFGHLRMAEELGECLALEQVRFIPSARPPHRDEPHGTMQQRAEMVSLGIAANPRFALDTRELERAGPSYMVDTLTHLRVELGQERPLALLLGADAFLGITTWHRWQELFDLAHVAVAHRPGVPLDATSLSMPQVLREQWRLRYRDHLPASPSGAILLCEITALDISSSRVRAAIRHHLSPRYLLPEAVCDYLHLHPLYQKDSHAT